MSLTFHTLDVFTDTPFAGNPLAVVGGADTLTTSQMQRLAREFNLSETIFLMAPDAPGVTARVRIFLPAGELPFAGHPVIGAAVHLATAGRGAGDFALDLVLGAPAGPVPVRVERRGARVEAELTAPVIPHPAPGAVDPAVAAAALGLDAAQVGFGLHRPGVFAAGPAFAFVPVRDAAALARARPVEPGWTALAAAAGTAKAYVYATGDTTDFRARMFAPGAGVPEDPATGSATAILAAQLAAAGLLPEGTARYTVLQGAEIGRPSHLRLTVETAGGRISAVRIAGSAVPISEGRIALP
jgi:trans-2,3-dihydro-3-hydroxyanthranilate isomerase